LDQAKVLLQRDSPARLAPQERQAQIGDQHHPDWGHDGVWQGFQQGLQPQGLLGALEEQLYLPPLYVKRRNGWRGPVERSGPEHLILAGFRAPMSHPSQHSGVSIALLPQQDHIVVRDQAALPVHLKPLCQVEPGIDLLPGDEEVPVRGQAAQDPVVAVPPVYGHNAALRELPLTDTGMSAALAPGADDQRQDMVGVRLRGQALWTGLPCSARYFAGWGGQPAGCGRGRPTGPPAQEVALSVTAKLFGQRVDWRCAVKNCTTSSLDDEDAYH
jgi:hypothetical protein